MIKDFLANVAKRSFARPTLFHIEITNVPTSMRSVSGISDFQRDFKFFAMQVDLPGDQILTTEHRHYDLLQKFAYLKAHDDLSITFRVDKDYNVKKFFDAWIDSVYNRESGNVFYKDDYVGQIQISSMAEDGSCPYASEFHDVFPTSIGNISYSWESTGQVAILPVTFTFTKRKSIVRGAMFSPEQKVMLDNEEDNVFNESVSDNLNQSANTPTSVFDVMQESPIDAYKDQLTNSYYQNVKGKYTSTNVSGNLPFSIDSLKGFI